MWVAHDYRSARRRSATAVAIGNFDGVHRGHQMLLDQLLQGAKSLNVEPLVLTFEPHPTRILAPERASAILTGTDRKIELLSECNVPCVVVQAFDRRFAEQTPEEFAKEVLLGLRAKKVYVGENFRFGKNRAGDGKALTEIGKTLGFETVVMTPLQHSDETISSSRVRKSLSEGDLRVVNTLLGRRFDFDGLVVDGDHRGRELGFPTANLRTQVEALPKNGVYAVRVRLLASETDKQRWFPGVMNIGMRPTIDTLTPVRSIEVHILDEQLDLYGTTLRIECVQRLRDEMKFNGLSALKEQISQDVLTARKVLSSEL